MFCFQAYGQPFHHKLINFLCLVNEGALGLISLIQTVFMTDIKEVSVVIWTGWVMISLMIVTICINFVVVIGHGVVHKVKQCIRGKADSAKVANHVDSIIETSTVNIPTTTSRYSKSLNEEHKF